MNSGPNRTRRELPPARPSSRKNLVEKRAWRNKERTRMTDPLAEINVKTRQAYNLAAQRYHDLFQNGESRDGL